MINRNERLVIDVAGIAARPDDDRLRTWLSVQRVFISSPMDDTRDDRAAVAAAIEALGATPIWFEEFGGRDADPTAAYTDEVDRSSIYLALLRERYGKMLPSGYSATHVEYIQARDRGLRISIWVAEDAANRDGHLVRFIEDAHVFHVTGRFRSAAELADKATRRLQEIAAEELSPWVKLGGLVFRADRITDSGPRSSSSPIQEQRSWRLWNAAEINSSGIGRRDSPMATASSLASSPRCRERLRLRAVPPSG